MLDCVVWARVVIAEKVMELRLQRNFERWNVEAEVRREEIERVNYNERTQAWRELEIFGDTPPTEPP